MRIKHTLLALAVLMQAVGLTAAPLRIALLDTEDLTGQRSDALVGSLPTGAIASKGAMLIGKALLKSETFNLIDRRDFSGRINQISKDRGENHKDNTTFLQAARALRADGVIKSAVLSLSTEKRSIDQGGYNVELKTLTMRVMLEVLDSTDGSIMGMADGAASWNFRVTANDSTTLGEEELLQLFENALAKAIPDIEQAVQKRMAKNADRAHVTLTVKTLTEPAMVEIDGMLVGTTPMDKMEIYGGDHVITISKPGYQEVSKRILVQKDTTLTVPMLRNELTMEELKEISKDMSLNRIAVVQPAWIMEQK